MWNLLCHFRRIYACRKISPSNYKKNEKIIYKFYKDKLAEQASLEFKLRKIHQTRNYLFDEIKHKDLISENH